MRTLRLLGTSTLSVVSVFTLSIRSGCLSITDHAPESPLRLSPRVPAPRWLYWVSPRLLLQSDTGVPHFALDPLTYRCFLSLSPATDFAEPRPPRHIPPPPDSGREVSLLESFRLMYSTGRSSPPISWVRTAPSPRSDASICSKKGREKSGECNSGPPHRAAFTWVKTCWHRSVHGMGSQVSGTSFLVRSVSGLVSSE